MGDWNELKRLAHEVTEGEVEWLDADEWRAVMAEDWADFVAACTPESILALIAGNERLARELAFTEQWYAVRMERLGDLGKGRGIWPEMAAIIANGTVDHQEPPTYAQQLVRANHRAKEAEARRDQLRAEVEALRKDAERYSWLREQLMPSRKYPYKMTIRLPVGYSDWDSLDAAIDAATGKGGQADE